MNIGTWMADKRHPAGQVLAPYGDALAIEVARLRDERYKRVLRAAKGWLPTDEMAADITASFVMSAQDAEHDGPQRPSQVLQIARDRIRHRVHNFEQWDRWRENGYPEHHLDDRLALALAMAWIHEED